MSSGTRQHFLSLLSSVQRGGVEETAVGKEATLLVNFFRFRLVSHQGLPQRLQQPSAGGPQPSGSRALVSPSPFLLLHFA